MAVVESADVVRDLGVMQDTQLTTRDHVSRTAQASLLFPVTSAALLGRDVTIQKIMDLGML